MSSKKGRISKLPRFCSRMRGRRVGAGRESRFGESEGCRAMDEKPQGKSLLWEMEMEVLAEGQEWMRRRLQEKLQAAADRQGSISPPEREQADPAQTARDADSNHGGAD